MKPARYATIAMPLICYVVLALPCKTLATIVTYTNETAFTAVFSPIELAIPDAITAFPGTTCGQAMTGIGPSVTMGFDSNNLTVSGALGNDLCIFNNGAVITPVNTIPNTMVTNTIVGNGEDDFRLAFAHPVYVIGLGLLTNNLAQENISFYDSKGAIIDSVNIDKFTQPNSRKFIGFFSMTAFSSLLIDTNNGAVQNEGIEHILIGTPIPEPSSVFLLGTGLLVAWHYRIRDRRCDPSQHAKNDFGELDAY